MLRTVLQTLRRSGFVYLLTALSAAPVAAAVVEPNGISVPAPAPMNETTLQAYFTAQGEMINAINDASVEPGAFLPLCDFKATLVLSQSNATSSPLATGPPLQPAAQASSDKGRARATRRGERATGEIRMLTELGRGRVAKTVERSSTACQGDPDGRTLLKVGRWPYLRYEGQ